MKLTELLTDCGFNVPLARILVYFLEHRGKHLSSREIERGSDTRQPEVSHGLADLIKRGWISEMEPLANTGKGRPVKLFMITVSSETIYGDIEGGFKTDIKKLQDTLVQLKMAMIPSEKGERIVNKQVTQERLV